jgi:pimeloyl-ACP methyl ester carboxylesterase
LNFVTGGAGAPPLVFVHGFACSHEDWHAQIEFFSPRCQVVACDLRGHGATPGRPHECSIEHYGGDVAALVSHLELKDCILVGHSMGCRVVLEAARLNPDAVAGIVLVDGSRQASGAPDQAEAAMRAAIDAVGFPAFIESAFRQMFLQWSPQAEAILARVRRLPAEVGTVLWPRMARWDAEHLDAALAAVRAPLMVIQSTYIDASRRRAPLAPGQTSPWLDLVRARVPGARIEVVAGVGHFTQLEAAGEVNRLIGELAEARR